MAYSSTKSERIDLLSKSIVVKMPTPVHSQKDNYEEGVVYIYTFEEVNIQTESTNKYFLSNICKRCRNYDNDIMFM